MQILLNNQPLALSETLSVEAFLNQQAVALQGVAVGINQQVVPKNEWHSRMLQEGDQVTLFKAIAGG